MTRLTRPVRCIRASTRPSSPRLADPDPDPKPDLDSNPYQVHKRKHQINSLAADCAANRIELEQRKSQGHKSKQQTQAKYGW